MLGIRKGWRRVNCSPRVGTEFLSPTSGERFSVCHPFDLPQSRQQPTGIGSDAEQLGGQLIQIAARVVAKAKLQAVAERSVQVQALHLIHPHRYRIPTA